MDEASAGLDTLLSNLRSGEVTLLCFSGAQKGSFFPHSVEDKNVLAWSLPQIGFCYCAR